ncbi:hypothetical protein [Alkalihalobacillus sp. 1P02AB]|uniref:hypothetical protein n=1 Tax=Alkalihalobacillus sp. 1P02AB TaxID=3132260 RepID=UPI0039A5A191
MGIKTRKINQPFLKTGISIVLIVLTSFLILTKGESTNQIYLMSIDGIHIPEEEFRMFVQDEKAATASYFYEKYGVGDSEYFWGTEYGGEKPISVAKKNALEKLLKVKVEQELAVQYGVLTNSHFQTITEAIQSENSMYGVEELNVFQEYMVFHSKVFLDTLAIFKRETASVEEDRMMEFYYENKDRLFLEQTDVEASIISFTLKNGEEQVVNDIIHLLQSNVSNETLYKRYGEQYELKIAEKHYGSQEGKDENSSPLDQMLKDQAYQLQVNEVSEPIINGNQYFLLVARDRTSGGISQYEDVKFFIEDHLKEEQFAKVIEESIQEAIVEINDIAFNQLNME